MVDTERGACGPFDFVLNALWEGRPAIDAGLGIAPDRPWTHRYRVALFIRTRAPSPVRSAVLVTGPFGDVKAYTPQDFYVSWYQAGLLAEGHGLAPPPVLPLPAADRAGSASRPWPASAGPYRESGIWRPPPARFRVEGGWVFALGQGSLGDRSSTLHRRDRLGIHRRGNYLSIDTGKYSTGPYLALRAANTILPL